MEARQQILVTVLRDIVATAGACIEAALAGALIAGQPVAGRRILQHVSIESGKVQHLHISLRRNGPSVRTDTPHVLRAVIGDTGRRCSVDIAFRRNVHSCVPAVEVAELLKVGRIVFVGVMIAHLLAQVLGEPALVADTLVVVRMTAGHRDRAIAVLILHRDRLRAGGHHVVAAVVERPRHRVRAHRHQALRGKVARDGDVALDRGRQAEDRRVKRRFARDRRGHNRVIRAFLERHRHIARTDEAFGDSLHLKGAVDRGHRVVVRHIGVVAVVSDHIGEDGVRILAHTRLRAARDGLHIVGRGSAVDREARLGERAAVIVLLGIVGRDGQRSLGDGQRHIEHRRVVGLTAADVKSALLSSQRHHVEELVVRAGVLAHIVRLRLHRTGREVLAVNQTGDGPAAGRTVGQVGRCRQLEGIAVVGLARHKADVDRARFERHRTVGHRLGAHVGLRVGDSVGEDIVLGRIVGVIHVGHTRERRRHRQRVSGREEELQTVEACQRCHRVAVVRHRVGLVRIAVRGAVVSDRRRCAGGSDRDRRQAAGDTELTQGGVDDVVAGNKRRSDRRVFDGVVLAGADSRHRAGGVDVGHLTVHEAVSRDGVARVGQRRAVIQFGIRGCFDVDGARGDCQPTVGRECKGHIREVRTVVGEHVRAQFHIGGTHIGSSGCI